MKIDIEKAARIYFYKLLITILDCNFYFEISDDTKCQLIIEGITNFRTKYTNNRYPYGHSMIKYTNDILNFHIHFNYKGNEHCMYITMYPKLIQRRLKINKLLKYETRN